MGSNLKHAKAIAETETFRALCSKKSSGGNFMVRNTGATTTTITHIQVYRSKLVINYSYCPIDKSAYKSVHFPQSRGVQSIYDFGTIQLLISTKPFRNELNIPKMFIENAYADLASLNCIYLL